MSIKNIISHWHLNNAIIVFFSISLVFEERVCNSMTTAWKLVTIWFAFHWWTRTLDNRFFGATGNSMIFGAMDFSFACSRAHSLVPLKTINLMAIYVIKGSFKNQYPFKRLPNQKRNSTEEWTLCFDCIITDFKSQNWEIIVWIGFFKWFHSSTHTHKNDMSSTFIKINFQTKFQWKYSKFGYFRSQWQSVLHTFTILCERYVFF